MRTHTYTERLLEQIKSNTLEWHPEVGLIYNSTNLNSPYQSKALKVPDHTVISSL